MAPNGLPADCTPARTLAAEMSSGQSWAMLYLALIAFVGVSGLKWTRDLCERRRTSTIIRGVLAGQVLAAGGGARGGGKAGAAAVASRRR